MIPGIGNIVTDGFSLYIVVRAAMAGCPPSVLFHMGLNVLIDNLVDKVPVLGLIFDFMWKANIKNVELMDKYFDNPAPVLKQSRWVIGLTLLFAFLFFVTSVVATLLLIAWVFNMFYQNIPG